MSFAFFLRVLSKKKDGFKESENASHHLKKICKGLGVELKDANSYDTIGQITETIRKAIVDADVIFVELSSSNENVWYELGYADKVDPTKIVRICRQGRELPFDTTHLRVFFIDPDDHASVEDDFERVRNATLNIISASAVYRMLRSDNFETIVPEYIHSHSHLHEQIVSFLLDTARDINKSSEERRRSIIIISKVAEIGDDTLISLTNRHTESSVRETVFNVVGESLRPIPEAVWTNGYEATLSVPVMRAAAIAAARHYCADIMSFETFNRAFLEHDRWEARKNAVSEIFKKSLDITPEKILPVVIVAAKNQREEVRNRVIEWVESLKGHEIIRQQKNLEKLKISEIAGPDNFRSSLIYAIDNALKNT